MYTTIGGKRVPVLAVERKGREIRYRLARPGDFDRRSFRTHKLTDGRLVVGCKTGFWNARDGYCRGPMVAQSLVRRSKKRRRRNPPFVPVKYKKRKGRARAAAIRNPDEATRRWLEEMQAAGWRDPESLPLPGQASAPPAATLPSRGAPHGFLEAQTSPVPGARRVARRRPAQAALFTGEELGGPQRELFGRKRNPRRRDVYGYELDQVYALIAASVAAIRRGRPSEATSDLQDAQRRLDWVILNLPRHNPGKRINWVPIEGARHHIEDAQRQLSSGDASGASESLRGAAIYLRQFTVTPHDPRKNPRRSRLPPEDDLPVLLDRMDEGTVRHLREWLERTVHPAEQFEVLQGIARLVAADPDLADSHSWPELRRMAEKVGNPRRVSRRRRRKR